LATRGRGPWELVYEQTYQALLDARRRELQIKRWKSATKIKELIDGNIG
jgi:predicted GIY-YIG superfamily endonuclease